MRFLRMFAVGLLASALSICVRPALAGGIDDFKLTRAIPPDVFMVVHTRSHAGQEWLNKQYDRVWKALEDAHLDRDLKKLLKGLAEQNEPGGGEKFEEHWRQVNDLIAGVEWSTLAKGEFAFCMKLDTSQQQIPMIQFVALMVPPADKIKEDFEGLSAILKSIADLAPDNLALAKDEKGDLSVHKLGFTNAPFPVGLTLARQKDTLLIGFGPSMPEQVLTMLSGQTGNALASTPRFKQAFEKLPPPADQLAFVDLNRLMTQIRAMMSSFQQMSGGGAPGGAQAEDDPSQAHFKLIGKMLDALDMFEYSSTVATTQGMKTTSQGIMALRDTATKSALYPVFFGNGAIKDPLKYIPQNAGDVNVWAGPNLAALYDAAIKFVSENVPEGKDHVAQFEQMQEAEGFSIKKDILSWVQGGISYFQVPGKTSFSPSEWAVLLTVRDEAKAREMLNKVLDFAAQALAQQNGSVSEAQIEGAEGFKSIVHPMLPMIGLARPTVGVAQGHLIIGSSPKIIEQSLAVAAGKEPSFAKSERFMKEGIPPQGDVLSLSFSDRSKMGEQIGQVLQMTQMLKMVPQMQEVFSNPVAGGLLDLASKLGPVFKKLDFMLSEASVSTFDGKTVSVKHVKNYREPPAPAKPGEAPQTQQ